MRRNAADAAKAVTVMQIGKKGELQDGLPLFASRMPTFSPVVRALC